MASIKIHDKSFKPYMTYAEISEACDKVAERINSDYQNTSEPVVFICVLNGAMMFMAEMMKRLNFPAELVSIKMTSYVGTQTTGEVKVPMGLTGSVEGRRVIVFEDIVDSGYTLKALQALLLEKGARDVRLCSMLLKPAAVKTEIHMDYVAKEIPNDFIVGFGLDYDELGRNLKDIYVID